MTDELPPDPDRVVDHLVGFVADLRRRGVDVPANAPIDGARALAAVGFGDADRARDALRATLITEATHRDTFDALFPEFWRSLQGRADPDPWTPPEMEGPPAPPDPEQLDGAPLPSDPDEPAVDAPFSTPGGLAAEGVTDGLSEDGTDAVRRSVYSPAGPSRSIAGEEVVGVHETDAALDAAIRELGRVLGVRRGRRWTGQGDERIAIRQTLRQTVGTGGTVTALPTRERDHRELAAVMLVDVSQSVLDTVARDLLIRFLSAAHAGWRSVRTFFFDTELREVTDAFATGDPRIAMAALEHAEAEWGGGTRIGSAVEAVCAARPPAVDRRTATIVISDGLEMGEVDRLADAMATLGRRSQTVLWLNPLAADPAYEPTCRGMAAALPHVDGLFAFADAADLEEVVRQLTQRGTRGRIGYRYDPRRPVAAAGRNQ